MLLSGRRTHVHVMLAQASVLQCNSRAGSCGGRPRTQTASVSLQLAICSTAASMLACGASFAATADANFAVKCAGCHVNGGNIVQAGATLFTNDLQKNNVADADSLYQLIYQGQGRMPGFGQDCTPKGKCTFGPRLSDEEIQQLSSYVLDRAAEGWSH